MSLVAAVGVDEPAAAGPGLLVLVDEHSRYGLLRQAFKVVTVRELAGDATDLEVPAGRFSAVVVDRSRLDLAGVDLIVRAALPSLAPGGRVLIGLDPDGELAPLPDSPGFDGLAWHGLELVAGRVCAVLRPGGSATRIGELLAAAHAAVRLATAAAEDRSRIERVQARHALAQQVEERYRSEHALLDHLERLASKRPDPTRRPLRVRGFLRRYRLTRKAVSLLRRARRLEHPTRG